MSVRRKDGGSESAIGKYITRALTAGSDWPDKDDLLDVVYWEKQLFALVIGITFGVINMKGILAILIYVIISSAFAHQYVVKYQKVDEEEIGGFMELAKEGFGAAFATYMVSWITVYSALHA